MWRLALTGFTTGSWRGLTVTPWRVSLTELTSTSSLTTTRMSPSDSKVGAGLSKIMIPPIINNNCEGEEVETDSVWDRLEASMVAVSELAERKEEMAESDLRLSAALATCFPVCEIFTFF